MVNGNITKDTIKSTYTSVVDSRLPVSGQDELVTIVTQKHGPNGVEEIPLQVSSEQAEEIVQDLEALKEAIENHDKKGAFILASKLKEKGIFQDDTIFTLIEDYINNRIPFNLEDNSIEDNSSNLMCFILGYGTGLFFYMLDLLVMFFGILLGILLLLSPLIAFVITLILLLPSLVVYVILDALGLSDLLPGVIGKIISKMYNFYLNIFDDLIVMYYNFVMSAGVFFISLSHLFPRIIMPFAWLVCDSATVTTKGLNGDKNYSGTFALYITGLIISFLPGKGFGEKLYPFFCLGFSLDVTENPPLK